MFRDRVFNISFLVSFAWHIFCIFAFALVITPKGFMFNKFPTIVFLGPILEEGPFHYAEEVGLAAMTTPYKEDFAAPLTEMPAPDVFEPLASGYAGASFAAPVTQKQVPDFQTEGQEDDEAKDGPVVLSGGVIYRPPQPVLPAWAKDEKEALCIDAEVLITEQGFVGAVDILSTTGYPEIDIIAARHIRGFIFEPKDAARRERIKIKLG